MLRFRQQGQQINDSLPPLSPRTSSGGFGKASPPRQHTHRSCHQSETGREIEEISNVRFCNKPLNWRTRKISIAHSRPKRHAPRVLQVLPSQDASNSFCRIVNLCVSGRSSQPGYSPHGMRHGAMIVVRLLSILHHSEAGHVCRPDSAKQLRPLSQLLCETSYPPRISCFNRVSEQSARVDCPLSARQKTAGDSAAFVPRMRWACHQIAGLRVFLMRTSTKKSDADFITG